MVISIYVRKPFHKWNGVEIKWECSLVAINCTSPLHTVLEWLILTRLRCKIGKKNEYVYGHISCGCDSWTAWDPGDSSRGLVSQNFHHYDVLNQGWGIPAQHTLQETLWLSFCGPFSGSHLIWARCLPINILPSLTQSQTLRKQIIQLYRWQKTSQSRVYSMFCSSTLSSAIAHISDCQGN